MVSGRKVSHKQTGRSFIFQHPKFLQIGHILMVEYDIVTQDYNKKIDISESTCQFSALSFSSTILIINSSGGCLSLTLTSPSILYAHYTLIYSLVVSGLWYKSSCMHLMAWSESEYWIMWWMLLHSNWGGRNTPWLM